MNTLLSKSCDKRDFEDWSMGFGPKAIVFFKKMARSSTHLSGPVRDDNSQAIPLENSYLFLHDSSPIRAPPYRQPDLFRDARVRYHAGASLDSTL